MQINGSVFTTDSLTDSTWVKPRASLWGAGSRAGSWGKLQGSFTPKTWGSGWGGEEETRDPAAVLVCGLSTEGGKMEQHRTGSPRRSQSQPNRKKSKFLESGEPICLASHQYRSGEADYTEETGVELSTLGAI